MRLISFDTETELIARGRQVPRVVVGSYAELDLSPQGGRPWQQCNPRIISKGLVSHQDLDAWLLPLLDDPEVHFTGANFAYDVLVTSAQWPNPDPDGPAYREEILARWVRAYDADRVTDLLTRQKLLDLAAGCYRREALADGRWAHHRYNLASLAWRLCRMRLDKGDPKKAGSANSTRLTPQEQTREAAKIAQARAAAAAGSEEQDSTEEQENSWRLRYAELRDVPIASWPAEARAYAIDDAVAGALVWHAQESGRPLSLAVRNGSHTRAGSSVSDESGYNVWSGSTDGGGLAAALTNFTTKSRSKGTTQSDYPLVYQGRQWPGLEEAWNDLSPGLPAADADRLMTDMIRAKFEQHPRLFNATRNRGGAKLLRRCSHFTNAKSRDMQAWEGFGENSRFIRNLIAGYEARALELGLTSERQARSEAVQQPAQVQQFVQSVQPVQRPQAQPQPRDTGLSSDTYPVRTQQLSPAVGPVAALWAKVRENFGAEADPFVDEYRQARGALWLRAMSAHGLRTDPEAVEQFATYVAHKHGEVTTRLVESGLVRVEWHLSKEKLHAWVADRCREMNVAHTGTKKAELLHLAGELGEDDPNQEIAVLASAWLQISKTLRASRPEPQSLEAAAQELARARFDALERAGLAHRTHHRDTKAAASAMAAACRLIGVAIPRTDSYDPQRHGEADCVALDKEACHSVQGQGAGLTVEEQRELAALQSALHDYAEVSHLGKILSADVPVLRSGTTAPIHTRFEELLETGRTGSSGPNVQNRARGSKCDACKGKKPAVKNCQRCLGTGAELGDRECYVPRAVMYDALDGGLKRTVLVDSDYSLGELHTLAQACLWILGTSDLADVLKMGRDPHTAMACVILGVTYEEGLRLKAIKDPEFDNARNCAKAVNFGKPGGLGIETMRAYAIRSYGVDRPARCSCLDKTKCKCITWEKILALWEMLWKEMPLYFRYVDGLRGKRGRPVVDKAGHRKVEQLYNLVQPWSGRLRAGATYCSACNSVYQGLLSDVLKRAGWYLFKACYLSVATLVRYGLTLSERPMTEAELRQSAALYGCRPVNEIHDQFLIEAPEERGSAAADATGLLMDRAGAEILRDVPVRCSPLLARRWSKRAEELRVGGELVAWEDPRFLRAVEGSTV